MTLSQQQSQTPDLRAASDRPRLASQRPPMGPDESLYRRLRVAAPDAAALAAAADLIDARLREVGAQATDLPADPDDLYAWMEAGTARVMGEYADYMAGREQGQPRRYFRNRAHALHFLRMVSPTKLVDGAWLAGLVPHADNPRLAALVRTYMEELGDGQPDKNHVLLYRRLLDGLGLAQERPELDAAWTQGAIQLALGCHAERYLPEIVGFNLGYEQLPLHLLITAYELDELGIDPYYFTLHVTVDNGASGHARAACDAVLDLLPRHGDRDAFWQRVREGSKLGCVGLGTTDAIARFDPRAEVVRILAAKAPMGAGAHANHCRLAGRPINDWLRQPQGMDDFLTELERLGWIVPGAPPRQSRFWQLLEGERAQMFGVFTPYELQVIHDWMRGDDSADGLPYTEPASVNQSLRRPRFRTLQARQARAGAVPAALPRAQALDPDLDAFVAQLRGMDASRRRRALEAALVPSEHWTPVGLHATRLWLAQHGQG